jgi:N-acetylmuramoyl-L-alanine amidase
MGRYVFFLLTLTATALPAADWSQLERYQQTISRSEFDQLLAGVYCPSGAFTNYLTFSTNSVTLFSTPGKTNALFTLQFATSPTLHSSNAPISRIALDPGHIGGEWSRMEERFFVRGNDRPVQEAVLNLIVARKLSDQLTAAGADVVLTKDNFEPVTDKRPDDFRDVLVEKNFDDYPPLEREAAVADAARKRREAMFYRSAEIAARARRINEEVRPDITLCIHFNAVAWNESYDLVDDNRLTVFVHGNYLPGEVADDEQKFRLMKKLLERTHYRELAVANAIADSLARATHLPPEIYGGMAVRVGTNAHVYARNLAASRLVDGPVIFLEPYYMNSRITYQRIQLGDYTGTKEIEGRQYKSIYREYADAVAAGLIAFFNK